jgi:peptidoglycan/LPS O-acetylase OafA/YrhL
MTRTDSRPDPVRRFARRWPAVLVVLIAVATLVVLIGMLATFPPAGT